jgi:hypothetical protein
LSDQRCLAGAGFGRNGDDPPPPLAGQCEHMTQPLQLFVAF